MARITVSIPDSMHEKILKIAGKENDSISYTVTRLTEIGLMVMDSNDKQTEEKPSSELDDHCQKLIIQMNGILKELAIEKFNFNHDKISRITNATLLKFNTLKGIQQESL